MYGWTPFRQRNNGSAASAGTRNTRFIWSGRRIDPVEHIAQPRPDEAGLTDRINPVFHSRHAFTLSRFHLSTLPRPDVIPDAKVPAQRGGEPGPSLCFFG